MNITCSAKACPVLLSAACVFYEGVNLPYTGINMNDNLQVALEKIDTKFNSLIDVNIYVSNGTVTSNRTVTLNGKTLSFVGSSYTTIFQPAGTLQLGSLAGAGNRMVIADTNGLLSTQAIPLGTVTSVDMSVPTGFAISGNPVTTSGTLALAFASGYSLPTNSSQSNWDTAYNWVSNFPALVAGQYLTNNGTSLSWSAIDLSGYVPYIGATQDVDLGTHKLTADAIAFSLTPTNSPGAGQIAYYGGTGALAYLMDNTTVMCQIGQQLYAYVTNDDTVTIQKGQPVYLYSATGNRASVKLAANTGDATSAKTLGLAAQDITSGQKGFIMCQGVLDGLNTGMYNSGDTLYLGPTAGSLTATKPYAPNHLVYIGVVERANNGNGQIYVRPQNGYELDEIHDVDLISTPPVNNDILTYITGTNNLWKPRSIATILGYTPANAATTLTINGTTYDISANRTWSVGTVTSIATSGPITGGTITTSGTIGITQATTSTDGYLSSTDWNTFNNKYNLPALTSGSVLFSNGTTIAQNNANFFWDNVNGRLGLGTSSPSAAGARLTISYSDNSYNQGFVIQNTNTGTTAITGMLLQAQSTLVAAFAYYPSNYNIAGLQNTAVFSSVTSQKLGFQANAAGNNGVPQDIWFSTYGTNTTYQMQIKANGNVQINTNTDAGYRLDVNGTTRLQGNTTISTGNLTVTSNGTNTFGYYTLVGTSNNLTLNGGHLGTTFKSRDPNMDSQYNSALFSIGATNFNGTSGIPQILNVNATVNSTGTAGYTGLQVSITDTGTGTGAKNLMKLSLGGVDRFSVSNTGVLTSTAAVTASAALARGVIFNPTLTAAANNDVLVGLDIAPTFTNGAFTGVSNWALRIQGGNISLGTSTSNPTINLAASNNASATQFVINNSAYGGTLVTFRNPADSRYFRISGINFDLYTSGNIYPTNVIAGSISFGSSYGTIIYGFNNSYLNLGGDTVVLASRDNTAASISLLAGNGDINFQQRPSGVTTLRAKFAISTGNFMIQNGGTFTDSGERLQVIGDAKFTGTMYQNSASDALYNFQNGGANKWRIGNAFVAGANYFQLYDSVSSLERIRWNNNSTATFTSDFTFVGGSNAVATFQAAQPDVKIQATGGSNAVSLSFAPSDGFEGVVQNNVTNGFIQVKTASTIRVTFKNGGQVNFQPLAADPAGAGAGDVYYNSGTNKLRLYDGTSWVDLN